eukprot:scaffold772_cov339-Pavlova_lutheri.AAC.68
MSVQSQLREQRSGQERQGALRGATDVQRVGAGRRVEEAPRRGGKDVQGQAGGRARPGAALHLHHAHLSLRGRREPVGGAGPILLPGHRGRHVRPSRTKRAFDVWNRASAFGVARGIFGPGNEPQARGRDTQALERSRTRHARLEDVSHVATTCRLAGRVRRGFPCTSASPRLDAIDVQAVLRGLERKRPFSSSCERIEHVDHVAFERDVLAPFLSFFLSFYCKTGSVCRFANRRCLRLVPARTSLSCHESETRLRRAFRGACGSRRLGDAVLGFLRRVRPSEAGNQLRARRVACVS